MHLLLWILVFCALGGVLSVLAAGTFLLLPERLRNRLIPLLVSFAIGALLGAALLALLPHALEQPGVASHDIGAAVLVGLLIFFLLEKMVLWRHSHADHANEAEFGETGHTHGKAAGYLILFGDAIHNLVDGVLIASAFLTDIKLGVVTSIAVVAHEIPQEVGDFAILLHSGFTRARALVLNILVSISTLIGGVVAYFSLATATKYVPYVLALAAASFIYIAVADLIPALHRRIDVRGMLLQTALILAGIGVIAAAEAALH